MPIYEYQCEDCKRVAEKLEKMSDRSESIECKECGGKAVRIVSRPSEPKFVGGGFTPRFYKR